MGPLTLGVRPEHVAFVDSAPLRGRIFDAEYLGTTQIVTVDTDAGRLKARLQSKVAVRAGETVGLTFRTASLSLFDGRTSWAIRTAAHEEHGRG